LGYGQCGCDDAKMRVSVDWRGLKKTKLHEYAVRFVFGGAITAIAGIVARKWGPEIGGLFLAFPAIFPASATLIEKHERQKKQRAGMEGVVRGRMAAAVDAAGSAMGSIGLLAFAVVVWRLMPTHAAWAVLTSASVAWLATAVIVWEIRKQIWAVNGRIGGSNSPIRRGR
jgi:hypothetical protein